MHQCCLYSIHRESLSGEVLSKVSTGYRQPLFFPSSIHPHHQINTFLHRLQAKATFRGARSPTANISGLGTKWPNKDVVVYLRSNSWQLFTCLSASLLAQHSTLNIWWSTRETFIHYSLSKTQQPNSSLKPKKVHLYRILVSLFGLVKHFVTLFFLKMPLKLSFCVCVCVVFAVGTTNEIPI